MVNIYPSIVQLLEPIAPVHIGEVGGASVYPYITLVEEENATHKVVDGEDFMSNITVQIDVWDDSETIDGCEAVAVDINKEMVAAGFERTHGKTILETDAKWHKRLQFSTTLNEKTLTLHKFEGEKL